MVGGMDAVVMERLEDRAPKGAADDASGDVPLERLEADLMSHAARMAAATGRWLGWLAEYDRRRGWADWGCRSCAQWLSFACGMSLRTGRDHVRVARGLEDLPLVAAALSAGELSFSKARALTRLERPIDEVALLQLARDATASQLDRIVAGHRQIDRSRPTGASADNDDGDHEAGPWVERRYEQRHRPDGMVEIVLTVPGEVAELIDASVAARTDELIAGTPPEPGSSGGVNDRVAARGGWSAVRADAAIELMGGSAEPQQVCLDIELTVEAGVEHDPTEPAVLATTGARLPSQVARRLACDATAQVTTIAAADDQSGSQTIGIGHRSRIVPRWLRRRVERRDRHTCRFPGCEANRRLHAHHIIHWADGGPTDLDNLLSLCGFHHHLVHDGGFGLTGTGTAPRFTRPDATPLTAPSFGPTHVALDGAVGRQAELAATSLEPRAAAPDRVDLAYIVDVTWQANERFRGTALG